LLGQHRSFKSKFKKTLHLKIALQTFSFQTFYVNGTAMLDPQAQALMQLMKEKGVPPVNTLSPNMARESYRSRRSFTQPDAPAVLKVEEHHVPVTLQHGEVFKLPVRLYFPFPDTQAAVTSAGPSPSTTPSATSVRSTDLPALVYLHGGGWTIGDLDTHDVLCRSLCVQAGVVLISVDYRLGPEHKFPAAYEDAMAAFQWAVQEAPTLHLDPHRIAIGGDSAGGNLAAAACLGLKDQGVLPAFQLLIYPATLMKPDTASYHANGSGYMLTQESMSYYNNNYLRDAQDATDWRAAPLLAENHEGLPAAFTLTAGYDPLKDEGLMYADALSKAGVPSQYVCFDRQIHGFITMGRVIEEANTAVSLCAAVLKSHLRKA
jgi:acetyl esterase